MIRRFAVIAVEVAAGLFAVIVLLLGATLWRLSTGPLELDFLTPQIEAALADPDSGLSVEIGATELVWAGWRRTMDFHARGVTVRDSHGTTVAVLPEVVVRLSLRALVQGTVAPTMIELVGARLELVRGKEGEFVFGRRDGNQEGAPDEADFSQVLPAVIEELMSRPRPDQPLSFLKTLRIVEGRVSVDDRKLGLIWEAPQAEIELRRDAAGLAGELALMISHGARRATLSVDFRYDRHAERIDLNAEFRGLQPETVASLVPRLGTIAELTTPLDGSLTAAVGIDGAVRTLRFNVVGGPGEIIVPALRADPIAIAGLQFDGHTNEPATTLVIDRASILLAEPGRSGPEIVLRGTLFSSRPGFGGELAIAAGLQVHNLPVEDFGLYWPADLAADARSWVLENIPRGVVDLATLELKLGVPEGDSTQTEIYHLGGTLGYRDLEVHFLRPVPPITGISGTATFDRDGLVFTPEGGRLGDLVLGPSKVEISGLSRAEEFMAIDATVRTPLRAALELLDHERLGLIRQLGLDPAATEGRAAVKLRFQFPLLRDLTLAEMRVAAEADLTQASVKNIFHGRDATAGRFSLVVDQDRLRLEGPVKLAGVPIEIEWAEIFAAKSGGGTKLTALIPKIDSAGLKAFGIDLVSHLKGPISASLRYTDKADGRGTLETAVNLQLAELLVPALHWSKPAGVAGKARVILDMVEGRPAGLTRIEIDAGSLLVRGRGEFDPSGEAIAGLFLDRLAIGGSKLRRVDVDLRAEGNSVRIGGGVLDLAPFLSGQQGDEPPDPEVQLRNLAAAAAEPARESPLTLTARGIDAVYFGPNRYLQEVDLELSRGPDGWRRIRLHGLLPKSLWSARRSRAGAGAVPAATQTLTIEFEPAATATDRHSLLVTTPDMGAALRALDFIDTIDGGRLRIVGDNDRSTAERTLKGRIEATDYVMVDAPILTRLLTLASLTGIVNRLTGEGVEFDRLTGEFTLRDGRITTESLRASGSALGLTAKGEIDFERSLTDLEGTVVPAYTFNRILGKVPLLGPLLTGGEGEGLFAFTYRMTGKLRAPEISINPLSALAPGILRGLFGASKTDPKDADAPQYPEGADQ